MNKVTKNEVAKFLEELFPDLRTNSGLRHFSL